MEMRTCPNCGRALPANANFCPLCGTKYSTRGLFEEIAVEDGVGKKTALNGLVKVWL